MGSALEPWQHKIISCAGPWLPTFAGFTLFLLWCSPLGRKLRSLRPIVNLYYSAIIAILVFPAAIVTPLYLVGIITDEGDVIGFTADANGPVWLVRGLLCGAFLISVIILWRVVPELRRAVKAQFLEPWKSSSGSPQA